jgi:hypothetical protein
MHNPLSLDLLTNQLLRQGLPRQYVRRVVQELVDHQQDIRAEGSRMQTSAGSSPPTGEADRLGDPQALVDAIVSTYRARTFWGRHPWLTFVIAPIPLVILSFIGVILLTVLMERAGDCFGIGLWPEKKVISEWPVVSVWCLLSFYYGLMFAPSVLASLSLCRLASRAGWDFRWILASCLIVGMFAGSMCYRCVLPATPGTGNIMIGWMGYPLPEIGAFHISFMHQAVQGVVPVAIGLVAAWRSRRCRLPREWAA